MRLDKTGGEVQGNKFFKLKYNIEEAKKQNQHTLLTFGGAFSNHIYATAAAGKINGLKTIGLIRGKYDENNPTLQAAQSNGMQLHFISSGEYKNKNEIFFIDTLKNKFGKFYLIPEGGTNSFAVKGCSEILKEYENAFDYVLLPCATGGTLAGIISTPGLTSEVTGISVLKGDDTLTQHIKTMLEKFRVKNIASWKINNQYHLNGYAKYNAQLLAFINKFESDYNILLDPVYSSKLMYGVFNMIDAGYFPANARIACVHTGGLQGWNGWNYRYKNKMQQNIFSASK